MTYNNNFERELGWEDEIVVDGGYVDLPDGLYHFTVTSLERGRYTPGPNSKLPACPKATVKVKIVANEGETELQHNLYLHSSTEGMLSAFFAAIGQKKKGEPLKMNWNIIGAMGICKIGHREYNGNKYNDIKSMLYPEDVDMTKVMNVQSQQGYQAQPAYTQPQNYQQPTQQSPQQPQAPQQQTFNGF